MKWKESLQSLSWLVIFLKGLIQIPASLRPLVVKIITSGWGSSDYHIGRSERRWNPGKRILSTVDREKLKPSAAVCLHKHSHSLVDVLPPESDSSIQDFVGTIFDESFVSVNLSFRRVDASSRLFFRWIMKVFQLLKVGWRQAKCDVFWHWWSWFSETRRVFKLILIG